MIFLMPIFKAVRDTFKMAEIDFLTLSLNKNIMETYPHIDSMFLIDTSTLFKFMTSTARVMRRIRKEKFDLVIDFEIFVRISTILSFLSAAGFKAGIFSRYQLRALFYDTRITYDKKAHITETYADLARKIGARISKIEPFGITVTDSDKKAVKNFLHKSGIGKGDMIVGMHIGSGDNFIGRRWPKENFAGLAVLLVKEYNCKVLFTGSAEEKAMVNETLKMLNQNKNVIDTAGLFSPRQLAYLLAKMNLFVSNDTGPLHIASCMGTSVIGLYGPNTPVIYGPIGGSLVVLFKNLPCSPCITNLNSKTSYCRDFKCMRAISVEEVTKAATECLKANADAARLSSSKQQMMG